MKQIYVPIREEVLDVWGLYVDFKGRPVFLCFSGGTWIEVEIEDAVPYDGELLPGFLDNFKSPTRDAVDALAYSLKVAREESEFKGCLDTIAKSRKRVFDLKATMESTIPGIVVRSVGVNGELNRINVEMEVERPWEFYSASSPKSDIRAGADARSSEGTRIGYTDPRGEGSQDTMGWGSERR